MIFLERVKMPFKYRAITANCGNDAIGEQASRKISELLTVDEADFFIINCQETDFDKTKKQLENTIPNNYKVACSHQMPTHTKLGTQFHFNTGITSFIIYKNDLTVTSDNSIEARRESSRIKGKSGYNKGGLVTDFTVTRTTGERLKIQAISGHLDAASILKRNQDWQTLYQATLKKISTWNELVEFYPDLVLSGYDANTRNKFDHQGKYSDMWDKPEDYPEIHALYHASLAAACYSRELTYGHDVRAPQDLRDPKRPGYAALGMLDFVGVSDGRMFEQKVNTDEKVIQIKPEPSTERDHSVIISPIQEYTAPSAFERIKDHVASRLQGVAPNLAHQIRAFNDNENERIKLVEIYKNYLNPNALLDKAIGLHTKKLECFNRLENALFLKNRDQLLQNIKNVLFGKWFTGDAQIDRKKQKLMFALLDSLNSCTHESGISARLNLYRELEYQITNNQSIDAVRTFKNLAVILYIDTYESFKAILADKRTDETLKERGANVLKQLDVIAHHNDPVALNKLTPQKLNTLTRIVEQCRKASECLGREGEEPQQAIEELTQLSDEARGSTSVFWRALGDCLDLFVRLVSFLSRLISKGETPTDAEHTSLEIVQDKRLSDSILNYKITLKNMIPEDENGQKMGNIV